MSYVIKQLFSTAINSWTRQRFSAEGTLEKKMVAAQANVQLATS